MILGLSQEIASLPSVSAGNSEGLTLSQRVPLWEVLARLAAQLDTKTASNLGCQMVQPILVTVKSVVDKGMYTFLRFQHTYFLLGVHKLCLYHGCKAF